MFTALRVVLLTDDTVSEYAYAHAINVWQFSIRTFGEYNDMYLKTDVLLLPMFFFLKISVTVASRVTSPAYYYTLPGFK